MRACSSGSCKRWVLTLGRTEKGLRLRPASPDLLLQLPLLVAGPRLLLHQAQPLLLQVRQLPRLLLLHLHAAAVAARRGAAAGRRSRQRAWRRGRQVGGPSRGGRCWEHRWPWQAAAPGRHVAVGGGTRGWGRLAMPHAAAAVVFGRRQAQPGRRRQAAGGAWGQRARAPAGSGGSRRDSARGQLAKAARRGGRGQGRASQPRRRGGPRSGRPLLRVRELAVLLLRLGPPPGARRGLGQPAGGTGLRRTLLVFESGVP